MENQSQVHVQTIILELEKRYPNFKKMDIYSTVSSEYKKAHSFLKTDSSKGMEELKKAADQELQLSL
jgi:hypothetical protein